MSWRIAGVVRNQDEADHEEEDGKPMAPSGVGSLMSTHVKVLQMVLATLRRKDREAVESKQQGVPMGLECSTQLAESRWAERD